MNSRTLVLSYLQSLMNRGEKHLAIDDDARRILREWMLAARAGRAAAAEAPAPAKDQGMAALGLLSIDEVFTKEEHEGDKVVDEVFFRLPEGSLEQRWAFFNQLLPQWKPLQEMKSLRQTAILAEGDKAADIMFVGEAPGFKEEEEGRPFVGAAGEKLDGMLTAMGLSRKDIYLTYLVKHRPSLPRQTTNNRAPNEKEIMVSAAVLEAEIALVQPRVIVALGVIAARGLLKLGDLPLSAYQAEPRFFKGRPVVVTHHPSYLLRTNDLAERRSLWLEMLAVMELVGLPISEKQRGYFLPRTER